MGKIYEYKSIDLGFKDVDTKAGIVTGYFASFNTVDAENDMMMPGSFDKTIKENFNRIKHLLDHDTHNVVGKIQILQPDAKGLYYESKAGSHTKGQDFLKMAMDGIITEHSFGYQIPKGKSSVKDSIRYISEVRMHEGSSLQTWGMNQNTPLIGVKSLFEDPEKVERRMKALESFCRNSDATDETIELLLIEAKQLSQLLIDITAKEITLPVDETTEPKEAVNWEKIAMAIQIL